MSLSKKQRRDRCIVLCGIYDVPLSNEDFGTVDHALENARDYVFCADFLNNPDKYRAIATITDGDPYPDGFLGYAKSAFYTSGGIIRPFRYATVNEISALVSKMRILARATDPALFLADGLINSLPAGLTFSFEFWQYPPSMADTSVADATTDGMPEETETAIIRGGFENLTKMMTSEIAALRLTQSELKRWQDCERRLYIEKFEMQNQNFRNN